MISVVDFPLPYWPSVAAAECDYQNALAHRAAASESLRQNRTAEAAEYYRAARERVAESIMQAREARYRELREKLYERGRV